MRVDKLSREGRRRIESHASNEMHLELIGAAIADEVEVVCCLDRKRKSAGRNFETGVVMVVENVGGAIAVGCAAHDEIILFDVRRAAVVEPAVDDHETFARP